MRNTLEAQAAGSGAPACIDFTAGGGGGRPGSQAAEGRRLMEALARHCQVGCHLLEERDAVRNGSAERRRALHPPCARRGLWDAAGGGCQARAACAVPLCRPRGRRRWSCGRCRMWPTGSWCRCPPCRSCWRSSTRQASSQGGGMRVWWLCVCVVCRYGRLCLCGFSQGRAGAGAGVDGAKGRGGGWVYRLAFQRCSAMHAGPAAPPQAGCCPAAVQGTCCRRAQADSRCAA
jgi:hypothetical protein